MRRKSGVNRILAAIILAVFMLSLTGCYDRREIDDLAYALAVGLDVGEANDLRLTLQLALPIAIGSGKEGGGGGGEGKSTTIITIDTPSIFSGLNLINNLVSKEINLSHAKVLIISKKLAEKGVTEYLNGVARGREFRPDIFIVVSNDPPDKYLENTKPIMESNTSKYFDLLLGNRFSSFYPVIRLDNFYFRNKSDSIQPVAIFSQISRYDSTDQLKDAGGETNDDSVKLEGEYIAGEIPVVSEQKVEVMGMAVFKNGKMVGVAQGLEAACYQLVTGDYNYSYWTIPDPFDKDKRIIMNIFQRKKPVIKADISGDRAAFDINIDIEGDFTSIQSNYNYEEHPEYVEKAFEALLEEQVSKFLKRTAEEFDSDICGLGKHLKKKFITLEEWNKFDWFDKYRNSSFNVNVVLKMRRTGLIIRSEEHSGR